MPVHNTKSGGYQYGKTGKIYYGKYAKKEATKQGQAIKISQQQDNRSKD